MLQVEPLSRVRRSDSKDSATSSGSSGIDIPHDLHLHELPTFQAIPNIKWTPP
jgi:hypothetical protein